jgi:cob(I)alamin adenosyltransferase
MKNGAHTLDQEIPGEISSLIKFLYFSYKRFGSKDWYQKGKNEDEHKKSVEEALNHLQNIILSSDYDVVIADEILYAVQLSLLEENKVINLIKSKPKDKELILTGSHIPFPNIFSLCDLVTEVKNIKHPYDSGIQARKGIEY